MKQKKPLSKGMKIGLIVVLAVAVGVLGVSIYQLLGIRQSYDEANHLYNDLASMIGSAETSSKEEDQNLEIPSEPELVQESVTNDIEKTVTEAASEAITEEADAAIGQENVTEPVAEAVSETVEAETKKTQIHEDRQESNTTDSGKQTETGDLAEAETKDQDTAARQNQETVHNQMRAFSGFDHASIPWHYEVLHDMYPDAVGWIYQEDTMSYPIVQAGDNDQYLRHMINGAYNVAGTLFVDYVYEDGLNGRYSIIYGHNMDDKSMFGSLTDYKDESYYLEHPVMEIYSGEYMFRYHVYASMQVAEQSRLLIAEDHMTDEEFLDLMHWVDEQKLYETKARKITRNSNVVVLATCIDYPRDYDYRYVVVLVREDPLLPIFQVENE